MDKVYLVFQDLGYDGKHLKKVFSNAKDAALFMEGADATYQSLCMEIWDVYKHEERKE